MVFYLGFCFGHARVRSGVEEMHSTVHATGHCVRIMWLESREPTKPVSYIHSKLGSTAPPQAKLGNIAPPLTKLGKGTKIL
jgi:hypothetical protein